MAAPAALVIPPPATSVMEPSAPPPAAGSAPRGFAPPSGFPLQRKMKRLQKQLRSTGRTLARHRWQAVSPACAQAEPAPVKVPVPAEAPPVAAVEVLSPAPTETAAVADATPVPMPVPAPDTRLVELQYEVVDLRHKLEALTATPVLDAAAVTALASKAPAFTEVQYEIADLRHQVQALQAELAALKASPAPAALKASQLEISDGQGRTVASISADGVISCSSVVLRANV